MRTENSDLILPIYTTEDETRKSLFVFPEIEHFSQEDKYVVAQQIVAVRQKWT